MVCAVGDCAPTATVNTGGSAGVSTSRAVLETYSVTGIPVGRPMAAMPVAGLVASMVMVPLQVPAVRPAVATDTVRVSFGGVTPVTVLLAPFNTAQERPREWG